MSGVVGGHKQLHPPPRPPDNSMHHMPISCLSLTTINDCLRHSKVDLVRNIEERYKFDRQEFVVATAGVVPQIDACLATDTHSMLTHRM